MKLIRFVFYRAEFHPIAVLRGKRKMHIKDDLISWWTWLFNPFTPGLSHVEGCIADENGEFEKRVPCKYWQGTIRDDEECYHRTVYTGTCYTSTMRGKDNGTVKRPASEVFKNPERWFYLEFEVTDESFEAAKAWADKRVEDNKGYSKPDLKRFFMPLWLFKWLKWDDPERDICSEFGEGMAIRLVRTSPRFWYFKSAIGLGLLDKILIRSPRRLWRDLVRRHHVPTYSLATGLMVRDEKGKKVK